MHVLGYRKTVLLLWPKRSDIEATFGNILNYACTRLENSGQRQPPEKDRKLADLLTKQCEELDPTEHKAPLTRAVKALQRCAVLWGDSALWVASALGCGVSLDISIMGVQMFVQGWKTFGFDRLRDLWVQFSSALCLWILTLADCATSTAKVLQSAESNKDRFELLAALSIISHETGGEDAQAWCLEQGSIVLHTLKRLHMDDVVPLVAIIKSGGIHLLQDM